MLFKKSVYGKYLDDISNTINFKTTVSLLRCWTLPGTSKAKKTFNVFMLTLIPC